MQHARLSKKKGKITDGEHRCVTITYGHDIKGKTLCLIFDNISIKEHFITGLQYFVINKNIPDP